MPTPVVGDVGSLSPRVNPPVVVSTDVTNNPIEEVLRLPVAMNSKSVHFRHHQATKIRLRAIGIGSCDFRKIMGMELATLFCHFSLEWKCFFLSWSNWNLRISGSRKRHCGYFGGIARMRQVGTRISMIGRVPSSWFCEIWYSVMIMSRVGGSGCAA